ncbi:hypothetical protein [Erwinia sp. 9145]|uniref:hypothetical protein n=1 Tax=Erwinia sp. 9145 TaxID=1500895 RepID=UPI00054FF891|nr:hypothetical protein [Erwinia sp. 9145]
MPILKEGNSRPLTAGEKLLAMKIFGDAIHYQSVKIHNGSYLPFNMQSQDVAMTPNGEIYFREPHYMDDFSTSESRYIHWFIHEMVHVLQHQLGMNVRTRGAFSWAVNYKYTLPPDKILSEYGMEQQASIIADYFYLTHFGKDNFQEIMSFEGIVGPDLLDKYRNNLSVFLANPGDKKAFL